jgi:hypothetical protein
MAANTAQKVSAYQACTAPKAVDALMILSANTANGATEPFITKHATVAQLTANITSNTITSNTIQATIVSSNTVLLSSHSTPASNSANGLSVGQMWVDDGYIYVVCTTGIKRAILSDF